MFVCFFFFFLSFFFYFHFFFFFNDTATTEIYTLSLHDALPISNSINDAVAYSIGSLKSTVEKESSDVYIGTKAAINVLKNIIKRRKNV